jgi:hypothetical protein
VIIQLGTRIKFYSFISCDIFTMTTYKTFNDWYYEQEDYGLRAERLTAPRDELVAAFKAGAATAYAQFGRMAFDVLKEAISEGCVECDSEQLADLAVKAGLMVHEPFDPAKHEICFDHDFRPGDMIYYWG